MTDTKAPRLRRSLNDPVPEDLLRQMLAQGKTNVEIAARFGCSDRTVVRKKRRLGYELTNPLCTYRFTDADRERLAYMVADGWPATEIRATTGWEYRTIRRHAPELEAWDEARASRFAADLRYIRKNAARPEWLPAPLGGRKRMSPDLVRAGA